MSYGLAQARYASDATQTASPARLLTMLYDRLILDLTLAHEAMLRGDIAVTGERIGHASEIILELHSTLDTTVWREGEALAALYVWMLSELSAARLRNQPQRVADVKELLLPLREAWQAAGNAATSGSAGVGTTAVTSVAGGAA